MAMTTFLFLRITHDLFSYESSGDTRRAALRPEGQAPPPVPPTCVGLPDVDTKPTAGAPCTPCEARFFSRKIRVPIDVHGSLDRVKDVSSFSLSLPNRFFGGHFECVRLAHADDVPLLFLPEGTCCRR
jgi:hypothetical protein